MGLILAAGLFILIFGCLVLFGAIAKQKYRGIKAEADKKELDANLVESNGETWVKEKITREENGKKIISIEYARLGGVRHRVNSHDHNPTPSEILYAHTMLSTGQSKQLLPGEYRAGEIVIEQKPNLLDLIDQYPHCQIYGASGGGKTSLLRTIAYRRQSQGHQVLILDSTEHPAKWESLTRIRNRDKQNEAIEKLFSIYHQNEEALSSGRATEQDFKQITVLSDEWTDIVFENELAKNFIREQVRKVRKFGIHLIFATQTDLASDLGLEGAYKTTNSFLKIEAKKMPDGKHLAIAKVGFTRLGEFDIPLPPPLPELLPTGYVAPTLETTKIIKPAIPEFDQQVIDMFLDGANYREITSQMWGQVGAFYNNKIDQILKNYGVNK
jgi:hypothetical protein